MHMLGSLPYGGTEYSRAEKASGTTQGRRATARDSGQLSAVMVALVFAALSQGRGKPAPLQRLAFAAYPSSRSNALCSATTASRTCFSSIRQVIRISRISLAFQSIAPGHYFEFGPDCVFDGNYRARLEHKRR